MPLQNRVTPFGDLIAVPERGLVYGNRGRLHDSYGNMRRHHNGRRWIACRLSFQGRQRGSLLQPGHYTELFSWMRPRPLPLDTGLVPNAAESTTTGSCNSGPIGIPARPAPTRLTGGCTPSGYSQTGDISADT
jgi:hypothetical protein